MMWFALIFYFIITYGALVISYYLPFTMDAYGLSTSKVGVATSMFYLAATVAGFGLSKVIKVTGIWTFQLALIVVTISLFCVGFIHTYASYILGTFMIGLGYGVIQPILYDKTSYFAPDDAKSTEYFAILLTSSYIALSCIPFIVEFFGTFIKGNDDPSFPFILNAVILAILSIVAVVKYKSFVLQAGVIPQGAGIVEQPSSVLDPEVRYVTTSLQDNHQKVKADMQSAIEESEAPVASPMAFNLQPSQPTSIQHATFIAPDDSVASMPSSALSGTLSSVVGTQGSESISGSRAAQIMKDAENSLAQAKDSLQKMRIQQASLLRQEAAEIEDKSKELHRESLQLIEEAQTLESAAITSIPQAQSTPPQTSSSSTQPSSTEIPPSSAEAPSSSAEVSSQESPSKLSSN